MTSLSPSPLPFDPVISPDPALVAGSRASYTLMVCGSPQGSSPELLRKLAADACCIIAVDSGANWLFAAGVTPDLVVGDLDSIDASILASVRDTGCRFVTVPAHKDFTDFDLALAEFANLQDSDYPEQLLISNVLGGRLDHELGALGSLIKALMDKELVWIVEDGVRAKIVVGEGSLALNDLAVPGSTFSIVALNASAEVSASGVEWELNHDILPPLDSRGVSNIINDLDALVTVHSGTALVICQ